MYVYYPNTRQHSSHNWLLVCRCVEDIHIGVGFGVARSDC